MVKTTFEEKMIGFMSVFILIALAILKVVEVTKTTEKWEVKEVRVTNITGQILRSNGVSGAIGGAFVGGLIAGAGGAIVGAAARASSDSNGTADTACMIKALDPAGREQILTYTGYGYNSRMCSLAIPGDQIIVHGHKSEQSWEWKGKFAENE